MTTQIELDSATATGNVRFRSEKTLLGRELLILQLEVTYLVGDKPVPSKLVSQTAWRDATLRDITKHTIKPAKS